MGSKCLLVVLYLAVQTLPIPHTVSRPEEIKRRKRWVDFVKRKRAKWEPSSSSCVCSKHFEPDVFVRKVNSPGQETMYIPWLKRDKVDVSSFPTLNAKKINI